MKVQICFKFLQAILAASSQGYVLNVRDGRTIGEQRSSEVPVMGQDRMDSTIQQKESTLDSVGSTIDKTYKTSRNSRSTDGDITTTLIDVYFANFDNIKALKIAFLKIVSTNVHFLIDEIEKSDVTSALDSPIVDFILEMVLPLLSGNNGLGNEFGGKKGLFSDPLDIGANLLQDKSDTPAFDVIDTENFTSMNVDPVFEESSTSATQSSVRKFLPL